MENLNNKLVRENFSPVPRPYLFELLTRLFLLVQKKKDKKDNKKIQK